MKQYVIIIILIFFISSCGDRGKNGEEEVRKFYFNNKNEINALINLINRDSLSFGIRSGPKQFFIFPFDIKVSDYRLDIKTKNNYLSYDIKKIGTKNIHTLFESKIINLILTADSIINPYDIIRYRLKIDGIKKIFKFVIKHTLYSLDEEHSIIFFSLDADVELIYKPKQVEFMLENINGLIFKNIEGDFYYYYNPKNIGYLFW